MTAGNSSPLTDGAAAAVLLSERKAASARRQAARAPPRLRRGRRRSRHHGHRPGPGDPEAAREDRPRASTTSICFEINEAFAAQAVYCQRELGIPDDKLNVNGGAIALGHPLGCTGAKLTATLLHELRRRGGKYGIVTMCIGGGMGAAGLFEAG